MFYGKTLFIVICLLSLEAFAKAPESICGHDERSLSKDPKVGRASPSLDVESACTVTMISNSCAITAGHCVNVLEQVQFNTPYSIGGVPQWSRGQDTYLVDRSSIRFENKSTFGGDWAVFKLKKNSETKLYPGEAQGYYKVGLYAPQQGERITVTGYGADKSYKGREGNLSQQSHTGEVFGTKSQSGLLSSLSLVMYDTDTMPGSSGAALILEREQTIIGVHTFGMCTESRGGNGGTLIADKPDFKKAIEDCFKSEL